MKTSIGFSILATASLIASVACNKDIKLGDMNTGGMGPTSSSATGAGCVVDAACMSAAECGTGMCVAGKCVCEALDTTSSATTATGGHTTSSSTGAGGAGGAGTGGAGGSGGSETCGLGNDPLQCTDNTECAPYGAVCDIFDQVCSCCWLHDPVGCNTDHDCQINYGSDSTCNMGNCACK